MSTMSHLASFAGVPILADVTALYGVLGFVVAVVIAMIVYATAHRTAELERERIRRGEEAPPEGPAVPNTSPLPAIYGTGPALKAPPAEARMMEEPAQFAAVRAALVELLDDMDEVDAHFVVPDMTLERDLGLEAEQVPRLIELAAARLGVAAPPAVYEAVVAAEDDMSLRELLARLTGTHTDDEADAANEVDAGAGADTDGS